MENIAANTEVVATPQDAIETVETGTEVTAEPTSEVETTKEFTETQRVSQRINEAKQQAKDELVAEMGYVWNGKPITTEKQYKEALAEQKEQERRAELEAKGIDPKIIDEAVENNPTVRQAKQQAAIQKNYADFIAEYPTVKPEQISKETWELVEKGMSLVKAYEKQEIKEMKAKLAEYEKGSKTQEINANNAASSTGSLTGNGQVANDFISFETFQSNKADQKWVIKNLSKIQESRAKW